MLRPDQLYIYIGQMTVYVTNSLICLYSNTPNIVKLHMFAYGLKNTLDISITYLCDVYSYVSSHPSQYIATAGEGVVMGDIMI